MELSDMEKKILLNQEELLQERMLERFQKLKNNILKDVIATKVECFDMAATEHRVSFKLNDELFTIQVKITQWEELNLSENIQSINQVIAEKLVREIFKILSSE